MTYPPLVIKLLDKLSPALAGRLVFSMFCKAKPTEAKSAEQSVMRQAREKTLDIGGVKTLVYSWGNHKKTVLLVHGWESRASRFYAIVNRLLELGYQVVAFDAPGHGNSEGDTVTINEYLQIMQTLQGEYGEFEAIVAHSLGALESFYAVKMGVRTKKLIAISSVCRFNYIVHRYASFFNLRRATVAQVERRLAGLFGSDSIWDRFSVDHEADRIGCDVVLIHDRKDAFVEFSQAEQIKAVLGRRAQLFPVQDVGHFRILSAPAVLEIVTRELLKSDLDNELFSSVPMPDSV